jgi:hypothetical protein
VLLHVTACRLAKSPKATLYTGGFGIFVSSDIAPIATGWNEPVPGRDFRPAVDQCLITAHRTGSLYGGLAFAGVSVLVSATLVLLLSRRAPRVG